MIASPGAGASSGVIGRSRVVSAAVAARLPASPLVRPPSALTPITLPTALVLQAAGINCDRETARAFELAGASAELRHVNALLGTGNPFDGFDLLAIPGGFSFGDDVAAGRILGDRLRRELGDAIRTFVAAGKPVIGICNGFQVLTQAGLLPGGTDENPVALDDNVSGSFLCRWTTLKKGDGRCVWTSGWGDDEAVELPVAHAEGRLIFRDAAAREAAAGRRAIVYGEPSSALPMDLPANPNASADDIAGLCDETGLVLGLMPHPERYVEPFQHPAAARRRLDGTGDREPAGLRLFKSAVAHVAG